MDDMKEFVAAFIRGMIGCAIVLAAAAVVVGVFNVAAAQAIQWRLIGSDPVAANTWSCTYEGRMSDGRTTITTIIHRGFACPMQPGAEF